MNLKEEEEEMTMQQYEEKANHLFSSIFSNSKNNNYELGEK
jgi:hypothetical protein